MYVFRKFSLATLLFFSLGMAARAQSGEMPMQQVIDRSFENARQQYKVLMQKTPSDVMPKTYDKEKDKSVTSNTKWWCSGFYPGTLWYIYEQTKDPVILEEAKKRLKLLEKEKHYTGNHDLGFMMYCSFGTAYRITGDPGYKTTIDTAARSLASRYRPSIKAIQSWDSSKNFKCPVIIDNMMNLELLEWVGRNGGDKQLLTIAENHANTTLANHFRPDHSCYHVVDYNLATGGIWQKRTWQGYSDASAWSRGQAWALYGYTMMYRFTRNKAYLKQAQQTAAYMMDHPNMPADGIPYWDYNAPGIPNTPRDASAAAVMASGLLELAQYSRKKEQKTYLAMAEKVLRNLASDTYTAKAGENGGFLLLHSTGAYPFKSEVDAPLTYADYYFLEALQRYKQWYLPATVAATQPASAQGQQDRAYWVKSMYKIVNPVIHNLAQGTLKKNMPLETAPGYSLKLKAVTYTEAVGRTIAGVAPWLELPDDATEEGILRKKIRAELVQGLTNAVNPDSPDYLNFRTENQPIVDAAYIAHAFLRAPKALWEPLSEVTKKRYIEEFSSLRTRSGAYNNWLLFAGITEGFLMKIGAPYDPARIMFSLHKMEEWYDGDGWYRDGEKFSMDYYNSYVIHPMLVDLLEIAVAKKMVKPITYETALKRMVRYSEYLERSISPEGYYPAFGRSVTYRTAAFQALAQTALMEKLPEHITPAQVRSALTKVIYNLFNGNQNFDQNGWLVLGFNGHQPMIADYYTSTGSLYMASLVFLTLGLPADNTFWTAPPAPWTAVKAWTGQPVKKDYKIEY